jgi:hypothetical protein
MEVVQPILERHCVRCHHPESRKKIMDLTASPFQGFTRSYVSLTGDRNFFHTGTSLKNAREALVPRFGARNQVQTTPPGGLFGARGSRLIRLVHDGHYKVRLSREEYARLALWIDCNAIFYGTYDPQEQALQLKGERVPMPGIQ